MTAEGRHVSVFEVEEPLEGLREDAGRAMRDWNWERSAFGHSLSLPSPGEIAPAYRHHYLNHPSAGALARCPHLLALFESLSCQKATFRLLRRPPGTRYAWHADARLGGGVVRFQIPLIANERSMLITTRIPDRTPLPFRDRPLRNKNDVAALVREFPEVSATTLPAGKLCHFDSSKQHTLLNFGDQMRVSLVFDLVSNDWLRARFPAIEATLADDGSAALAAPGPLALAIRKRLNPVVHALRNRARRIVRGS